MPAGEGERERLERSIAALVEWYEAHTGCTVAGLNVIRATIRRGDVVQSSSVGVRVEHARSEGGYRLMCTWGTDVILRVPIPAHLSHTGEFRWDDKGVDSCITPLVAGLIERRVYTANSCCGHGKGPGSIILHDGQKLTVAEAEALVVRLTLKP